MTRISNYEKFRRVELVVEKKSFVYRVRLDSLGYDAGKRIVSGLSFDDHSVLLPAAPDCTEPKTMGVFDVSVHSWSLKHDENGRPVRAFARDDRTFVNLEGKVLGDFGRPVNPNSIWYDGKGRPVNALAADNRRIVNISGKTICDFGEEVYELCRDKNGMPISAIARHDHRIVGKNGKVLGMFKNNNATLCDAEGRTLAADHGLTYYDVHGKVIWAVDPSEKIITTPSRFISAEVRHLILGSGNEERVFDFGQPVYDSSIKRDDTGTPVSALATDNRTVLLVRKDMTYVLPGEELLGLVEKTKKMRK